MKKKITDIFKKEKKDNAEVKQSTNDKTNNVEGNKSSDNEMKPIGEKQINEALLTLHRYKSGKASIDDRCIDNEIWWKVRQNIVKTRKSENERWAPKGAELWNVIVSKHADAMDAYPEANILPRAADDKEEAKRLKEIIPVIIERCNFENVYSDIQWQKLKQGTGIYGIFWDKSLLFGMGDIAIKKIDELAIFWEPGVTDIQDSANVFVEKLFNRDVAKSIYPNAEFKSNNKEQLTYRYDDNVDTSDMVSIVDWYYKRDGILHLCKFSSNEVLFASENSPEEYPNGWYDHGLYPFVFDNLFAVEGTPCGYGYIDIFKNLQEQIDMLNDAAIKNARLAASPRFFIRADGSVNEEEFADFNNPFIHTDSNLGSDSILPMQISLMNGNYLNLLESKIAELKESSGNRDAANGGTTSGVTAASAIAAMQEASGKLSRDASKRSYNSFALVIGQVIELIRQFYDTERTFRIIGSDNKEQFINYSNENIMPQYQGNAMGVDMGYRLPVFDIKVSAQKASAYTKMSQNELALQFYNAGFFEPARANQALACLDIMDFDHKDEISAKIEKNQTYEMKLAKLGQLALTIAQRYCPEMVPEIGSFLGLNQQNSGQANIQNAESVADGEATTGTNERNGIVERAKEESKLKVMPK